MTTEDYVSFETAKLLKEKGFDELCPTFYEIDEQEHGPKYSKKLGWFLHNSYDYSDRHGKMIISAPTLQMAMKWLREEKGIAVIPVLSSVLDNEKFLWDIKIVVAKTNDTYLQGWIYETQESACKAAIKFCLENLI